MTTIHSVGRTCKNWWTVCIAADTGAAKRARAELRRASSVIDALSIGCTHELSQRLAEDGIDVRGRRNGPDHLALIALTLAHVKEDHRFTAARQFGISNTNESKPLSSLRFNALIRTMEPRELVRPLVRALGIINGAANVSKLATDLYWWNDKTRTNWCFDYHGAMDAKPDSKEHRA